eukprot:snap_masked-scaffold_6-processed-gene-19.34-mRNA-1 protein AED:1.00 eAED:1.00 QI:0/-1/0/0/-1/1/1/0/81
MEHILSLKRKQLSLLQKSFDSRKEGLDFKEFCSNLQELSDIRCGEGLEELKKFFERIDINGNGKVDWNEFSEYCILVKRFL